MAKKTKRRPVHKYRVGNIVGICADCMANCEILELLPKRSGRGLSYVAKAVTIHHPRPKESFFGKNPKFEVLERKILIQLF